MSITPNAIQEIELRQLKEFAAKPDVPLEIYLKDAAEGIGIHSHSYWEIFLYHSTPDGPIENVTIVPPGIRHGLRQSVIGQYTTFFDIGTVDFRCSANFDRAIASNVLTASKLLLTHLTLLKETMEAGLPDEKTAALLPLHERILAEELLVAYQQTLQVKDSPFRRQLPKDLKGCLLKQALQPNCTIADIAASIGVSSTNVSRIFQKNFGCSARRFLIIARLRCACERLAKEGRNTSISAIAVATGWNSPRHFQQTFKKLIGMTPTQYAEKHQGKPPFFPDILLYHNEAGAFY